jgi:hypothetical protein
MIAGAAKIYNSLLKLSQTLCLDDFISLFLAPTRSYFTTFYLLGVKYKG